MLKLALSHRLSAAVDDENSLLQGITNMLRLAPTP